MLEQCGFSKKFLTWIIAYCFDTESFFVTNQRYFSWEYEKEFQSEQEGIEYFQNNADIFVEFAKQNTHWGHTEFMLENTKQWFGGDD